MHKTILSLGTCRLYQLGKTACEEDADDVGLHDLGCRVDILGTNCNSMRGSVGVWLSG